jgi:DNA-binding transcriptional MocR family regulator
VIYKVFMEKISDRLEERTARGIANAIGSLISDGHLEPGESLPTVRALAAHLAVGHNTVMDAWRILRSNGAIVTDRRRGTTVRIPITGFGGYHWEVPIQPGTIEFDLSTGTPDNELLPPVGSVLHGLKPDLSVSSYRDAHVLAELEKELRRRWPYEPDSITIVDGALDALDRVVNELVDPGNIVVVEDPTFPPILAMLKLAGARIIGVPLDQHGVRLAPLAEAMTASPRAIFLQPSGHNPTGSNTTRERAHAIAHLIDDSSTIIVEDDHASMVAGVSIESVGQVSPDRVIHIRSFSKSHGPDLRIAAIGGPSAFVGKVVRRRQLGPSWTSRLIQRILLGMLTDPASEAHVAKAADVYRQRRLELRTRLAQHGIDVIAGVGLNMWIPVGDEQRAVVALAAHGIGVAPGRPFRAAESREQHIRISVGAMRHDIERVARTIALVAKDSEIASVT